MNCKPGDLAVTTFAKLEGNAGRVVKVVSAHGMYNGRFCWWIESEGTPMACAGGQNKMRGHFPDEYLRPISGIPDAEDMPAVEPINEELPA